MPFTSHGEATMNRFLAAVEAAETKYPNGAPKEVRDALRKLHIEAINFSESRRAA